MVRWHKQKHSLAREARLKRFGTPLLLLLLALSTPGAAIAQLVPAGEVFGIGSESEIAFSPVVAVRPDGAYLILGMFGNGSSRRLQGRFYGPGGAPLGNDFFVVDTGEIGSSAVSFRPDGGFVVAYAKAGEIRGVLRDRDGQFRASFVAGPQRQPGLVNEEPSVAVAPDGSWMIAWQERVATTQDLRTVYGRWFAADATPRTQPAALSSRPETLQSLPRVAATPDGGFFAIWMEDQNTPVLPVVPYSLVGRRFDGAGSPLGLEVRLATALRGRILPLPGNQGFVVVADEATRGDILLIRVDPDGRVVSPAVTAGLPPTWSSSAALDAAGRLLVTGSDDFSRIQARLFDAGTFRPISEVFELPDRNPTALELASARAGQFLMVWQHSILVTWPIPEQLYGQLLALDCDIPGSTAPGLCLRDSRFRMEVSWRDHQGNTGVGHPVPLGEDTGTFWFFSESNVELLVKILDGRNVNDHFWVFYGSLSDVQYEIRIEDTLTGIFQTYVNPPGHIASHADVNAFPAEPAVSPTIAAAATPPQSPRGLVAPLSPPLMCTSSDTALCLLSPDYLVTVDFVDPLTGETRHAQAIPFSRESGAFWFFDPGNVELFVKVIDGSAINNRAWVFHGALTDVEYTITVQHNLYSTEVWTYKNPRGRMHSGADTSALPPPSGF
jgi:hypothetical protein